MNEFPFPKYHRKNFYYMKYDFPGTKNEISVSLVYSGNGNEISFFVPVIFLFQGVIKAISIKYDLSFFMRENLLL
jgi:hypothetical protein